MINERSSIVALEIPSILYRFTWTMERDFTIWSSWNRKDNDGKGCRNWMLNDFLQHICFNDCQQMERRFWKISLSLVWVSLISSTFNNILRWNWFYHVNEIWWRSWSFKMNENRTSDPTWWVDQNSKWLSISIGCLKLTLGVRSCFITSSWEMNFSSLTWIWSMKGYDLKTDTWRYWFIVWLICFTNRRILG